MGLIIGLGTGRCGTTSLARLLHAQSGAYVSHELDNLQTPPIPEWGQGVEKIIAALKQLPFEATTITGDVALFHLPYVEHIAATFPDVRFICMKRPKHATVSSFLKKTGYDDPWSIDAPAPQRPWGHAFPKFAASTKRHACELYWEYYYQECDRLQQKYPDSFFMFSTEDLSTSYGVRSILDACNIPRSKQRILFFHENKLNRVALYQGAIKHYARTILGNRTYEKIKRAYYRLKHTKSNTYFTQPV